MKKFLQYVNPYSKIWQLFAANGIIASIVMFMFWGNWHTSFKVFILSFVWAFTISFTQWMGHVYINNKLSEKYSWQHDALKRTVYGFLAIAGYAVIAYLIVQLLLFRIINGQFPSNPWQWALKSSVYAVLISSGVTLIFTTIGFFKAWKKSLLEAEQFKSEMLAYKYEALQHQLNPHFLFNSFNVLSDLVYEDQEKAVRFIKELSRLFRYVLDSRDKELVTINSELKFIRTFLYLLQMRFEDKLLFTIEIDAHENEFIVPMALQLLVENCVKHNEVSLDKKLTIDISRTTDTIIVKNNLQIKNTNSNLKKTGLANIKQQYGFFTDREVLIEKTDSFFEVKLPILIRN